MDTTTAAQQAGVTVATIRTWCRRNVIAALKVAGRWVIDTTSLVYRITLTRKAPMVDLTATYTWTEPDGHQTTVAPKVRDKTRPDGRVVSVSGLAPLLADHLDAITDDGDRVHTLMTLAGAVIALREEPAKFASGVVKIHARMDGRVSTTYAGTAHLTVDQVLDLGERLHSQLI